MTDDLNTWLDQQLENQRFRAGGLKAMAFALPAEARAVLTETAEMLLADVDAKRRILDLHAEPHECPDWDRAIGETCTAYVAAEECPTLRLLTLSYASQPGYRPEWRPA